jgi:hypothetical protein
MEAAMPHALSEAARALLRRRLAGEDIEVTEKTLPAYRELARAGLMEPGSDCRTPEALARQGEFLPQEVSLSEGAVAVLRFRAKGYRVGVNDRTLEAYRELVRAGVMSPVAESEGGPKASFRFTEDGWARREEWIGAAEAYLRSLQPLLPDRIDLSESARNLLLRRVSGERVEVTPENKGAYRELAAAGIMYPMHSFAKGDESVYKFTEQGWERRFEWLENGCVKEIA